MIEEPTWENSSLERLIRKQDQAWEMAGLARMDGDKVDEQRHLKEAERLKQHIRIARG